MLFWTYIKPYLSIKEINIAYCKPGFLPVLLEEYLQITKLLSVAQMHFHNKQLIVHL